MTAPGAIDPGGYPAPGSATPGAPPPLKRALTPADGVSDTTASARMSRATEAAEATVAQALSMTAPSRFGPRLGVAAAMFGVAAGLEIAGVLARSRRR